MEVYEVFLTALIVYLIGLGIEKVNLKPASAEKKSEDTPSGKIQKEIDE